LSIFNKIKKFFVRGTSEVRVNDDVDSMSSLKDYYEDKFQSLQNDFELINGELVESFEEHSNLNKEISMKLSKNFKMLVDRIDIIEDQLEEKNRLIRSYEEGHKYNNVKNICLDIIEIIRNMEQEVTDWDNQLNIYIFKQLNNILNDNFVYGFIPAMESKFNPKNSKYIISEKTDMERLDGKVSEIIHMGYRIKVNKSKYKVLRPAEVKVFKFHEIEEDK